MSITWIDQHGDGQLVAMPTELNNDPEAAAAFLASAAAAPPAPAPAPPPAEE